MKLNWLALLSFTAAEIKQFVADMTTQPAIPLGADEVGSSQYISAIKMCSYKGIIATQMPIISGVGFDFTDLSGDAGRSLFTGAESGPTGSYECTRAGLDDSRCFVALTVYSNAAGNALWKIDYKDSAGDTGSVGYSDGTEVAVDS